MRLDRFTRRNADIALGERVNIRPAEETAVASLTLSLPEGTSIPVQFGSNGVEMVKRYLLHWPVVERDIVPVMTNLDYSSKRSPVHTISLSAIATEPHSVVRLTEETTVTIEEAAE